MADDDKTANDDWNEGVDFALTQLCNVLGVDTNTVCWDAATETADGDVRSVIGNILTCRFDESWQRPASDAEASHEG